MQLVKGRMKGVSMVVAPDSHRNRKERHEPDEIFQALIADQVPLDRVNTTHDISSPALIGASWQ